MGNCWTRIDNCFNFDTVRAKIARGAPAVIVVGEDDDAASRRYRKAISVSPNGGGHHNAGTVVPTENDPAFDCARSEHRAFRNDLPQPLPGMIRLRYRPMIGYALKRTIDAIVIATKHRRPRHQPNVRLILEFRENGLSPRGAGCAINLLPVIQQSPTKHEVFIANNHSGGGSSSGKRCCQTGRPTSDDQHVAESIGVFIMVRIGASSGTTESGRTSDQRLIHSFPERGGPHEGFVVKTGADERRKQ